MIGVAAKRYFDTRFPRLTRGEGSYDSYINETIRELVNKITPIGTPTPAVAGKPWTSGRALPMFFLEKPEDGLDPDLSPLYEDDQPTKERAEEVLTQIQKKKEGQSCLVASA